MAIVKKILWIFLSAGALQGIAVEYNLDKPIDFKLGWSFLLGSEIYLQHQCSTPTATQLGQHMLDYIRAVHKKLGVDSPVQPLQVRLHANAQVYRNRMRFSREREGHYNADLNILTSHCGVGHATLDQQLVLYLLRDEPLRTWQKVFIAEVLPGKGYRTLFADAAKAKPAPLESVMLSNHTPGKAERALLAKLGRYLQKTNMLEEFALALAHSRAFDDTGMEILERLTGESVAAIQTALAEKSPDKRRNNTLRNFKR